MVQQEKNLNKSLLVSSQSQKSSKKNAKLNSNKNAVRVSSTASKKRKGYKAESSVRHGLRTYI